VRHRLSARDVAADAAARLGLDPSVVAEIFDGAPLDFPIVFATRLPLFAHRLGMIGITIGARVWLLDAARRLPPESLLALVRHEAEHVRQQRERPLLFYPLYGLDYLRTLLSGRDRATDRSASMTHHAYRTIGYERAAYAADAAARERIARALGARRRD
jgi:hypothetical protein